MEEVGLRDKKVKKLEGRLERKEREKKKRNIVVKGIKEKRKKRR